ncbi:unnamed protein product [Cylindrotheca closterium]|uniref:Metallo-beta-lactamase domain-containing protein n=1 Tax=Cylindrotheca closterium TaxID=2856 RepID=A0AAD2FWU2_9STRA|nr:unnamed protein product [Cylindrotheca closterium]
MNERHIIYTTVLALLLSGDHHVCGFVAKQSQTNHPRQTPFMPSSPLVVSSDHDSTNFFKGKRNRRSTRRNMAAPQRLSDNVNGPLYVNDKCINCAACSMFAPQVFGRSEQRAMHIVQNQPSTEEELETARAALRACPVAAIRLENQAYRSHRKMEPLTDQEEKIVDRLSDQSKSAPQSFPRPVSPNIPGVYFVGHHNSASFGAAPYLLQTQHHGTILMDSPKFSKRAVETVEKITGPDGTHNWIGDETLEEVEILLQETNDDQNEEHGDDKSSPLLPPPPLLQAMTLEGTPVSPNDYANHEVLLLHTPGHSPGSITLWRRPTNDGKKQQQQQQQQDGILFTGDTYSYTTRDGGHMTAFPRYGNDYSQQAKSLEGLLHLDWHLVAPGHGHPRDYTNHNNNNDKEDEETIKELQRKDMQPAFAELL